MARKYEYGNYVKIKNYPKFETKEEAGKFIKAGKPFLRKQLREGKVVLVYNGEQYYLADVKEEIMAKGGKPKDLPVIHTQFEEEEFEYADGGEIRMGDIVEVIQPNHTARGQKFVFEKWLNDEKTAFRGKEDDYGREIRRVYDVSPETVRKLTVSETTRKAKSDIQHRRLLSSLGMEYYADGGKTNERYKIIQDVSDLDDPSGAWLVVDTQTDRILAEFDFKKEAQAFLYDYQMRYGKMAHGGKTGRHRKKTLEEKAMESVGTDTWFQLDKETQAGVIAEMVTIGALPQRMAKGAKVAKDYSVTYELMDGKKVVEKYGSEEEMDEGIANFYIMNDVKDAIVAGVEEVKEVKEVVADKPKKKSLFDTEKAAPKVSKSKETAPVVHVDGLEKEIGRYDELKAIIKNADAEKEIIGGLIKDIAKEKYLEVYEQQGKRPTSIILESGGTEISYTVLDKYKIVTPEKETVLKEYDNLLGTDYTFTFDNEILDQKGKNGEKIADIINELIENSDDIPDDVKSKLVKITKKVGVKKGSIEKLLAYKSPAEILQVIEPVEMLK